MTFWTFDRITHALFEVLNGARIAGSASLGAITTDTRSIARGDVFVALKGERFDAHDFLSDAVVKGASALVVHDATKAANVGVPVYVVRETAEALGLLGRYRRRAWGKTVVAVAGSNGKTGTKTLVTSALGARFRVHATVGNLNNHVGVPLTLLAIPDDADIAVVEIGTNHPGEVATLGAFAEPDVALVTSIGEEHLEGFGDLAGVLREECAVYEGASLGIAPASHPEVAEIARGMVKRLLVAGLDAGDVHPSAWGVGSDGRGWMTLDGETVTLPWVGAHSLRNAMLAVAVAREVGIPVGDIARAFASLPQLSMRSTIESLGDMTLLSDCYNANPASAREALATFDSILATRPGVVVLGSMLELGARSDTYHDEIARLALATKAKTIAGVGEFQRAFRALAPNDSRVVVAQDADALWPLLRERVPPNALVLLKGSRGTRLERLIPQLRILAGVPPAAVGADHH